MTLYHHLWGHWEAQCVCVCVCVWMYVGMCGYMCGCVQIGGGSVCVGVWVCVWMCMGMGVCGEHGVCGVCVCVCVGVGVGVWVCGLAKIVEPF